MSTSNHIEQEMCVVVGGIVVMWGRQHYEANELADQW